MHIFALVVNCCFSRNIISLFVAGNFTILSICSVKRSLSSISIPMFLNSCTCSFCSPSIVIVCSCCVFFFIFISLVMCSVSGKSMVLCVEFNSENNVICCMCWKLFKMVSNLRLNSARRRLRCNGWWFQSDAACTKNMLSNEKRRLGGYPIVRSLLTWRRLFHERDILVSEKLERERSSDKWFVSELSELSAAAAGKWSKGKMV